MFSVLIGEMQYMSNEYQYVSYDPRKQCLSKSQQSYI